jgi:hypothetical protein
MAVTWTPAASISIERINASTAAGVRFKAVKALMAAMRYRLAVPVYSRQHIARSLQHPSLKPNRIMRPEDVLPGSVDTAMINGVSIRKGSVAAFLANASSLRDPAATQAERAAALVDIEALLPGLRALGLFDVLEIRDPSLRAFVEALSRPRR